MMNATKSNVRNDRCKDNKTREREFWYRVSVRYSCSEKSETLFPVYFALYFSRNQSKIFSRYIKIYTIDARFMITHVQYENRNTFTCLLIDSFCSTTFSLVPFVRSLFLTYVQRISHKNAGWSIIRAIHLDDTRGFAAIKRFLMCAAQVRMKMYGNLKSHKTFDADVFAHLYRMPPKKTTNWELLLLLLFIYYSIINENWSNTIFFFYYFHIHSIHWSKMWNALNLQYVLTCGLADKCQYFYDFRKVF